MRKTILRLSLLLLAVVFMSVCLPACGHTDEPDRGTDPAAVEDQLCGKIWSTYTPAGTYWFLFDRNGTFEETRIGIPIEETRASWYFTSDDCTAVHISGGNFAYVYGNYYELSFPGDQMTLTNFGETFTFTNLSGGGGGGGSGGDTDTRTPTEVLCITVYTVDHNETVEYDVYDWYLGFYGSAPALYKNRNDYKTDYVVLGRTNTDRDFHGYNVSGFKYVATESPLLHMRVYYYFS